MRTLLLAATALVTLTAAAHADSTYVIDKVTIKGNKSVTTESLMAVVKEHAGMHATKDDIIGDQDAISAELTKHNVTGGISTQLLGPKANGHFEVTFIVKDAGVVAPTVTTVQPKLDQQTIDGNVSIPSDKLLAATGLKPGDEMTNEKMLAAETAIQGVYKDAKLPVSMSINGASKAVPGGKVDLMWHIIETKAKKKKRNTDDQGGQSLDQ